MIEGVMETIGLSDDDSRSFTHKKSTKKSGKKGGRASSTAGKSASTGRKKTGGRRS